MASKSRTKGNPKRTKSDHQKLPASFHSNGQFPPGFVPYGSVPFPQQPWQGDAGFPVYPQVPWTTNNPYAPDGWNRSYPYGGMNLPQPSTPGLKKRIIRPPSKEYLASKLVDDPFGLMNMNPREDLDPKKSEFHTPWIWNPIDFKEDEPALPPSPPPEDFTSKLELKPTFSSNIVRTHNHYRTERPRQTTEPGRTTSPIVAPLSVSDDSFPSTLIIPRSTSFVPPVVPRRSTSNSSSESPPPPIAPFIPPRPISQNGPSSLAIIPPRSASPSISATPTGPMTQQRKARKSQPVDLQSTNYEVGREDEPEYLTPNANQTAQLPPQNSEPGTAPWILASRKLHAPKKPVDVQFISRMTHLRQQTNGTGSTSSTPQGRQSLALLGSPVSIASSAFSQSFSVASPPPAVEFPPTPVFTDQIPEGFLRKLESLSIAQTPKASLTKPYPVTATRSLATIHEGASSSTTPSSPNSTPKQQPNKLPASTSSVRRGYWNRRGDHLTPEGYLVFAPPDMQYPDDLKTYPFENEGYRNHSGLFTAYVERPELPQSLWKHGNPPERPYESFVVYV